MRPFRPCPWIVVAVLIGGLVAPMPASAAVRSTPVPSLDPGVIARALRAPGTTVRRDDRVSVESVTIDARTRALIGSTAALYRVTIEGRYVPRALRYVVRAGGVPVAYGYPRRDERALVAVTTDPTVLTAPITVKYGSTRTGPAILPRIDDAASDGATIAHATPGPYEVTRTHYDLGDRVYQPPGLTGKVELVADVHHPTDLSGGPFPIVLLLHGNHSTCYRERRSRFEWPCRPGWRPIPNYEGYDYLAERLASFGYVVVSVSGNGVNVLGDYLEDTGMRQRGALLEKHLDLWERWNTVGGEPFGTTFVGAIDMTRIGVMGHSRGGEGAVYQVIVDRERPDPYGIDAVLPLAPVDFTRQTINDVALGLMLPYCDGDVYDLQGVHFFDDSRYAVPSDATAKATVVVYGANHNFFNTVWSPSSGYPGAFDDGWDCEGRLSEREQRRVAIAYIVNFFRKWVGASPTPGRIWTGERTPDIAPAKTAVSYLAPDVPGSRMDLDRFLEPSDLLVNELGGAVVPTRLGTYAWCLNVYDMTCVPGDLGWQDIHMSWSWFGWVPPGLQEGIVGWSSTAEQQASLAFEMPPGSGDVSIYDYFGFRTVPNPGYSANSGVEYQDLVVALRDADGHEAQVGASDVGNDALAYPLEGRRRPQGHIIMNQIRFPLSSFEGVDLSEIVSVELRFSRVELGVIDIADMAFWSGG